MAQPEVTLFYDGACHLCSREASHYKAQPHQGRLAFVDIAAKDFDAKAHGLAGRDVNKSIHATLADGRIVAGVDAFVEVWERLPKHQWLARLSQNRFLRPFLNLGYRGFARVRLWLPRRVSA